MPEFPPANGVTRAVLNYVWDTQKCANVLHFINPEDTGSPDPMELASRLQAWWTAGIAGFMPATLALDSITATDLSSGADSGVVYTTNLPDAGSGALISLPNNVSLVMSLRTGIRGRSFRGRIYHVGLTEATVTNNQVSGANLANLLTIYNQLLLLSGDVGEPDHQLCVLSYWSNKALRATPVATPVVNITSDGIIDSQRRRLPGRGR